MAETAAVIATGVSAEDAHEIKSHIDHVTKNKIQAVERMSSGGDPPPPVTKNVVPPPPGLAPRTAPTPPLPPGSKPSMPEPPAFISGPSKPPGLLPIEKKQSSVTVDAQPSAPESRVSRTNTRVSQDIIKAGSTEPVKRAASNPDVNPSKFVVLYGKICASKPVLDILTWRSPALAVLWMLFAVALIITLVSKRWSSLTVWSLFALGRVIALRLSKFAESLAPERVRGFLVFQHSAHLPGSFTFVRDLLYTFSGVIREVAHSLEEDGRKSFAALVTMSIVGIKLNVGIAVVVVLFTLSIIVATHAAMPQVFVPVIANFPSLGTVLSKT